MAVDREYRRHAVLLDTKFCGVPRAVRGQPQAEGPVQRRLASYGTVQGWSFGVWGEASDTVHSLIHTITEARLKISAQQPGRRAMRSIDVERAQLVGSLRRQISFVAVRANACLILSRMESHVGQGAGEAAKRRQHVAVLERQERRERQGKNLLRRGQFLME